MCYRHFYKTFTNNTTRYSILFKDILATKSLAGSSSLTGAKPQNSRRCFSVSNFYFCNISMAIKLAII